MNVGAFTGIVAAAALQSSVEDPTARLLLAMAMGGVMAGIMGAVIGLPVLRLRGDYLAIVTLAFGEILKNVIGNLYVGLDGQGLRVALNEESVHLAADGKMIVGGPLGATHITRIATFPVGFVLVLFTLFVVLNLINSKEGRAMGSPDKTANRSLPADSCPSGIIKNIKVLGSDTDVSYTQSKKYLTVKLSEKAKDTMPICFKIEVD